MSRRKLIFENQGWHVLLLTGLLVACLLAAAYTFYSVGRYFSFTRAVGADHFDTAYRKLPIVNEGIFRYTSNGTYAFGFLLGLPAEAN